MNIDELIEEITNIQNIDKKIEIINEIKTKLHEISPFNNEPVDCVLWVKCDNVVANSYNPNSVASIEYELLRLSINNDGYTQPIVTFNENNNYTVVDGFHRNKVGKECIDIKTRIKGYLPITIIRNSQKDIKDRIASTIRHNRARGKHKIEAMSDIIIELKRRNWSDEKIGIELGMEQDEVLRLCQISGLLEMFKDQNFSEAWEINENDNLNDGFYSGEIDEDEQVISNIKKSSNLNRFIK